MTEEQRLEEIDKAALRLAKVGAEMMHDYVAQRLKRILMREATGTINLALMKSVDVQLISKGEDGSIVLKFSFDDKKGM